MEQIKEMLRSHNIDFENKDNTLIFNANAFRFVISALPYQMYEVDCHNTENRNNYYLLRGLTSEVITKKKIIEIMEE